MKKRYIIVIALVIALLGVILIREAYSPSVKPPYINILSYSGIAMSYGGFTIALIMFAVALLEMAFKRFDRNR